MNFLQLAMKRSRSSLISPKDAVNRRKKKANKKTNAKSETQKFLDSIQMPLNNRFNALSENEDITDPEPIQKKVKFAPIVVTDVNKDIHKLITDLNLSCDLKITSVGKKIIPKSADDISKITEVLDKEKVNYFSHPNSDKKIFKAVLRGLPEIDTAAISGSLTDSHKITPSKIIMFNTKSSSKLYLCHFDKGVVNMNTLNTIKSVYHHVVSWQTYKPKKKTVTQCYRCTMFGHGISTCKRFMVCMLCAENHLTTECNTITKDTVSPTYKCFNCAGANLKSDHKANDMNCPFRAKYITTIEKARGSTNKQSTQKNENDEKTKSSVGKNIGQYVKAPTPHTQTYAEAAAQPYTSTHSNARNASTKSKIKQSSDELFTFAEVTELLLTCINDLKRCKTKFDQIVVITNLMQHAIE